MYSSAGTSPEYSYYPFKFLKKGVEQPDYSGTCAVLGKTKYKGNNNNEVLKLDSNDLIYSSINNSLNEEDDERKFSITPTSFYTGECVNNSVRYKIDGYGIINIPIHFYLNRYGFAHLNQWDGNSIQINNDQGYILATQMGAGSKNNENQFSGVLMGEVKYPGTNRSERGLLGYGDGTRTFFLNSDNGSAILGTGNAQIILDPSKSDGNYNALLYSHNFWTSTNYGADGLPINYTYGSINNGVYSPSRYVNQTSGGLLINLSKPEIIYGSGNFYVDSNGNLHAENANITGEIHATLLDLTGSNSYIPASSISENATLLNTITYIVNNATFNDTINTDRKIETWSGGTLPSSNWVNSEDLIKLHQGDIWYCSQECIDGNVTYQANTFYRWNDGWQLDENIPSDSSIITDLFPSEIFVTKDQNQHPSPPYQ